MSRLSSQRASARRALVEDLHEDKKGWLQHGIAALAVSVLGLGVASSIVLTGAAQHSTEVPARTVEQAVAPGVKQPSAFDRRDGSTTSRSIDRTTVDKARVAEQAEERSAQLDKEDSKVNEAARAKALAMRTKQLKQEAAKAKENASRLSAQRDAQRKAATTDKQNSSGGSSGAGTGAGSAEPATPKVAQGGSGRASLPVTSGYSIAARFGEVGSWSRYHTGFDFAAPIGTPLNAADNGVVTNAGSGSANGWAGTYVTIKHADGTSTLYAHMSSVTVSVGSNVSGGQLIGYVGLTGRTFGPHLHFEVYPPGITPGDVYRAVDPAAWMAARGLRP